MRGVTLRRNIPMPSRLVVVRDEPGHETPVSSVLPSPGLGRCRSDGGGEPDVDEPRHTGVANWGR
jgi:hypothetical protein